MFLGHYAPTARAVLVSLGILFVAWPAFADDGGPDDQTVDAELRTLEAEIEDEEPGTIDDQLEELEAEIAAESPGEAESAAGAEPAGLGDVSDQAASPPTEETSFWSNWSLYRDPVLCALIAGAILGLLGVYVVSRRIVFVTAALSQVAAFGITLGFFVVGTLGLVGFMHDMLPAALAIVMCLIVVFALTWVGDNPSLPRDALLGTAFVIPMGLVLMLAPYIPQEMHEIEAVLHGSAVVVREADLWAVELAGAAVLGTQLVAFRGFVFASLDPLVARVQGVPVRILDIVLFGSIALMTGLVTRALGALPTFALTVLPAVGAIGLTGGLKRVFAVAAISGAVAGAGGYWVAFEMDWSVGASQTLVAAVLAVLLRLITVGLQRSTHS